MSRFTQEEMNEGITVAKTQDVLTSSRNESDKIDRIRRMNQLGNSHTTIVETIFHLPTDIEIEELRRAESLTAPTKAFSQALAQQSEILIDKKRSAYKYVASILGEERS